MEPFQHPILLWQSGLLPIPEDYGSNPVISRLERIIIKILIEKTENNEKEVLNLTCKTSYIIPFSRFKVGYLNAFYVVIIRSNFQ